MKAAKDLSAAIFLVVLSVDAGGANGRVPSDVRDAVELVVDERLPLLNRVEACKDAHQRWATAVPWECLPETSTTLGFAPDGQRMASFESKRYPGCGEHLPESFVEARTPGVAPRRIVAISPPDGSLAAPASLERAWLEIANLSTRGFVAPTRLVLAKARLTKGDVHYEPAAVLDGSLNGWWIYADPSRRTLRLIGERQDFKLGTLPRISKGFHSLWEVALSPDGLWLIVRLALIDGNPCEPGRILHRRYRVPDQLRRVPQDRRDQFGNYWRRCRVEGDNAACERWCERDRRGCDRAGARYEAGVGVPRDLERAGRLYSRGCDQGDGGACIKLEKLYLAHCATDDGPACGVIDQLARPVVRVIGKGPPIQRRPVDAAVKNLERACRRDELEACVALADLYEEGRLTRRRSVRARALRTKVARLKRAACRRNDAACE